MIYVFDDVELDTQCYELRQGGVLKPLEPQGFDVLVYLIAHRDRVISKDELLEQLWPNQIVSESTLAQRLRAARRTLNDSGRNPRYVKTVHGRGYRFIAEVFERVEASAEPERIAAAPAAVDTQRCPECQHENAHDARFCNTCSAPLSQACSACQTINPPHAAFCKTCANPLTPSTTPLPARDETRPDNASPPSAQPVTPEAERRQLTVMFCDVVGSTQLSEQLDPEDYRDLIRSYQTACEAEVARFEGHIAQLLGDALLVYFGWPAAHEDDAQRAVQAGLGMLEAMEALNGRLGPEKGVRLAIRVAIHTGLVVVGEMGGRERQEQLALGAVPNIAARLEGLAAPNTLVVSAATHRLAQGYFTTEDLGLHELKGVAAPVQVYQVLQASGVQHRFELATAHGLTPFIGRDAEVTLLRERWRHAMNGMGQIVMLSGEAGIGKSRLVQHLKERADQDLHTRLELRCSPYHQHSAFYPIVDCFERFMGFDRLDSANAKRAKLDTVLSRLPITVHNAAPLLATLLSLPLRDTDAPLELTPQQQRRQTMHAALGMILALAEQQPILVIVEDLHWIDPSTLEWIGLLVDQAPTLPLAVILTSRPTFDHPWGPRTHLTSLMLNRLSHEQAAQMVTRVANGKALPADVVHHVVNQTDGVPLFIEELTKAILESELVREIDGRYELSGPLNALAIPATLQDSLMARLDRLGTAKGMAQWGATLGRQFSYALLQAVSQREDATLQRELGQLVEAELLYQRGVAPQATYLFKHALIQDVAYQSLLRSTRQYYHQRAAGVLVAQFPGTVETHPELIAHHYTEAHCIEQAIPYWERAGQLAIARSAHSEAVAHVTRGLDLLTTLPNTPERARQELALRLALGASLSVTQGWPDAQVGAAYHRAQQLCQQLGDTAERFPVLWGLWHFHSVRGEHQTSKALGERLYTLAQQSQEPAYFLAAHFMLGGSLAQLGAPAPAIDHWRETFRLYDPDQHHALTPLFGADPGVFSLSFGSHTLWLMGYPDQALARGEEALALAQDLSHPFSLALAHCYLAMLRQFRGEPEMAQQQAEAAMSRCAEQGFAYYLAWATILRGWALTALHAHDASAIEQLNQGFTDLLATGAGIRETYYRALLAEVYVGQGQIEMGEEQLAAAFEALQRTEEGWWLAELYRLQGTLLKWRAAGAQWKNAEDKLLTALEVARSQQAKSLELRAAISLARLRRHQGKRKDAYDLLAPVYGWFTEGFDTADLIDANALLHELSEDR